MSTSKGTNPVGGGDISSAYSSFSQHRCGAGTNNIQVDRMTELGIPVFNTPGANANAVKELVICGMLLGSRRVVDGINHMADLGKQGLAKERVEKDKALFGGQEIAGKTLAVIGLGTSNASCLNVISCCVHILTQPSPRSHRFNDRP